MENNLCQCGCGIRIKSSKKFVRGHHIRSQNPRYPYVRILDHPKANPWGYVYLHTILAEKALGGPLPQEVVVHHHTSNQLVICQDQNYHKLIHKRTRAYKACGHAAWRKCKYCQKWDSPDNLRFDSYNGVAYHRDCSNEKRNKRYHENKIGGK